MLQGVKYPMGDDRPGKLSRLFGVFYEEEGVAGRGTFILDPGGVIVCSEVNHLNVGRNAEELLRKLRASIHIAGHSGEVCPAKWEPGEKTLKPSAENVGNASEAFVEIKK